MAGGYIVVEKEMECEGVVDDMTCMQSVVGTMI